MKKILAILLFTPFAAFSQSCQWISHNDSLFVKCGTDSTHVTEWTFYLLAGKMYNGLAGQVLKKNSNNPGDYSWGTMAGGGDLLAANNLSDVANAATARTNLGVNTTVNISNSTNKNFVTDAQLTVIGNTSGTNSGDNATNSQYSGLVSNANHTGDATGATALTLATVNSNVGSFGSATQAGTFTVNGKGLITAASNATIAIPQSAVTNLTTDLGLKAPLASPTFTGTPTGIGLPVYAQVTGSNATTTGQTLVNVTGLSIALTTNATYEFEAVMSVSTSAVTTGTAYGVNYSVAGGAVEAQITGASTSTASKTLRINALNTATTLYLATSAQTGGVIIKGRVTTGVNAGNFTVSHLKLTSGTSTVFIGSFLKVIRII